MLIKFLLNNLNIKTQYLVKNFDNTLNKNYKIDFYIPDIKLAIEYNGEQHYKPIKFGSTMSDEDAKLKFKNQQFRDNKVREICKNNNIELIEIKGNKCHSYKLENYIKNTIIPYINKLRFEKLINYFEYF